MCLQNMKLYILFCLDIRLDAESPQSTQRIFQIRDSKNFFWKYNEKCPDAQPIFYLSLTITSVV